MVNINFVEAGGNVITAQAEAGLTVMVVGRDHMVPGILGDCGGACACATCHVIVDQAWVSIVGGPSEPEQELLAFADGVQDTSRLGCQITVTQALEGLVLHLPKG